jgi:hypothetical protein
MFGERHRNTIYAHQVQAAVLAALGRAGEAEALARRALELCLEHHSEQVDTEIRARQCLAGVLRAGGNEAGQASELQAALLRLQSGPFGADPESHPAAGPLCWTLAEIDLAAGRPEAAAARARALIARAEAASPVEGGKLALARGLLGRALGEQGQGELAEPELRACFEAVTGWSDLELAQLSNEKLDSLAEVCDRLGQARELERLRRIRHEGLPP